MFGIEWLAVDKLKSFFGGILKSPWLYIAVAVIGLSLGTYFYLNHEVKNKVETAVKDDRKDTTIQTLQTQQKVTQAVAPIDNKYDSIRLHTQQEYSNVRAQVQAAPAADREAAAPDLIIDTLNALSGMQRNAPEPDGVSNAASPSR